MLDKFEEFMQRYEVERNPTPPTKKLLRIYIPKFLGFCKGLGRNSLEEITPLDVISFLNSMDTRTSTKKATKAYITLFMNFCYTAGICKTQLGPVVFKGPKDTPRAPIKGFTNEEMKKMRLKAPDLPLRERIIFRLISRRPLRVSELAAMTVGSVDLEARSITLGKTKNGTTRVITIPKEVYDDLSAYIGSRDKEENLFGVETERLDRIILELIKHLRINPNGRNSHAFRHTAILHLLRKVKADPGVVAAIAGNTPKTIFSHYCTYVSAEDQRKAEAAVDRLKDLEL